MTNWHPAASLSTLHQRAQLLQSIRAFFQQRNVLEVQTPVITAASVTDIHIDSMQLADNTGYLRTSPEYFHKRLLAAGYGDIYEIGAVFRARESGRWHRPEFTLLEWYRVGWSYHQLIDEVIDLLQQCSASTLCEWDIQSISYADISKNTTGINFIEATDRQLLELAEESGLQNETDRNTLLDFLFSHLIQRQLPKRTITCILDFPAAQAALSTIDRNTPACCQRFEVFLEQTELANGYQELTDPQELLQRFEQDNAIRQQQNRCHMPIDSYLIDAMQSGLPECAGVALGIDRWLQKLANLKHISETASFH